MAMTKEQREPPERPGVLLPEMARHLFGRPATQRYPAERIPVPKGFRGRIEVSDEHCIGCSKCALVCPTDCIEMVSDERDVVMGARTVHRKRKPIVHLMSCIRCGLCEEACPTDPKAIYLTEAFGGAYERKDVVVG